MGWIDEKFDHDCIKHFQDGEDAQLDAFLSDALPRTGNGAHEIRDWVIAHAAAGSRGFELIDYFPRRRRWSASPLPRGSSGSTSVARMERSAMREGLAARRASAFRGAFSGGALRQPVGYIRATQTIWMTK